MKDHRTLIIFLTFLMMVISVLLVSLFWDLIKLSYDENNLIKGEAFYKKINPNTNTLRFLIFVISPILIFLFSYIFFFKTLSINPSKKNFFLKEYKKKKFEKCKEIEFFLFIFIIFIFAEFFLLNYNNFLTKVDIFHEGTNLVPPINFKNYGSFWETTYYDYGLFGNNRSLLIWNILGTETIGSARLFDATLILLNKISLVIIGRKISFFLDISKTQKLFFFLIFTLLIINLSQYFVTWTYLSTRVLLFLIFLIILLENIKNRANYINNITIGFFSSISFLWWIDIGFFINAIILFYLLLLIFLNDFKKIFLIIFGIFLSWLLFLVLFKKNELLEFYWQTNFLIKTIEYFNFLELPRPFSVDHKDSFRSLKSLLIIIINGVLCCYLCLSKEKINFQVKLILIILFIASIIFFKTAVTRSDSYHIRSGSGITFLLFFFIITYLIVRSYFFKKNIISLIILFKEKKTLNILYILFIFYFTISDEIKNMLNKNTLLLNLKKTLYLEDSYFLRNDEKLFIEEFKKISIKDKCVQVLTDYQALPYFLRKPTCTQFPPSSILESFSENKFLEQLKKNMPNFILYDYEIKQQTEKLNMPNVDEYIKKNYSKHSLIQKKWVVYKKN